MDSRTQFGSRFQYSVSHDSPNFGMYQPARLNQAIKFSEALPTATPDSFVNVRDFGAKGGGIQDDTNAFNSALSSFDNLGGIVYVPSGTYRINGALNIPRGTTLQGTYQCVSSHEVAFDPNDLPNYGSVLLAYGGRGNESGAPFISVAEDSTVRGLVIFYPEQVRNQVPQPYPWTIALTSINCAVIDVECLNCWNFISAVGAHRHFISRVQGQPINTGILIDAVYDIGRVEDAHWNPWYSQDKLYMSWQLVHGRAFVIARTDWEYFFNTFAFGYSIGYHFIESSTGSCNGNFLGIGADMMANASVLVESSDPWGILVTNGEFTAFVDSNFGTEYTSPAQIIVTANNKGSVRFTNTAFWGPSDNIARVAGGTTSFVNCIFTQWDAHNTGAYAIEVTGGSVQIATSDFRQNSNQVYITKNTTKAIITGNLIAGETKIHNECLNTAITANVAG